MDTSEKVVVGGSAPTFYLNQDDNDDDDGDKDNDNDNDTTPADKSADLFSRQVPPNAADPKSADSLIASQMAKLSVADREKVYMDIHGIPDFVAETPELVQQSLLDLQEEIDKLPDKKAYNLAEKQDASYVEDKDFRLAFLRCDRFDCQKAALRIVRHFQMKLYLFGADMLAMDIIQDDLDTDDMAILYGCSGRFLKVLDAGGRLINLLVRLPREYKTDSVLRRAFYNIMTKSHDTKLQQPGVVVIVFHNGEGVDNADLHWKLPKLNEGCPMYISAIHLCYSQEVWEERHALIKNAFNKPNQVRIRVHHGAVQKCLEELCGHGIDPFCIPVNDKGEITDHVEECQRTEELRRQERLKYPARSTIGVPFFEDVLLGKGTPFQTHAGNQKFRKLVVDRQKEYEKVERGIKRYISQEIVDIIKGNGGLFLKQDGSKWVPVDNEVAVMKVSNVFRTLRSKGNTK